MHASSFSSKLTDFAWGRFVPPYAKAIKKMKKIRERWAVEHDRERLAADRARILQAGRTGYRLEISELGLTPENLESLRRAQERERETVIGDIDQDGFLLSNFGPIEHLVPVSAQEFLKRRRFNLQLVAVDGYAGVKKDYRGDKLSFVNEVKVLDRLRKADCRVPTILDVDFARITLTVSFIAGKVLREELAQEGASLRDRELRRDAEYRLMARRSRRPLRAEQGREALSRVCGQDFIEALYSELARIHEAGVVGNDIKYGNVIIESKSGLPFWIDFDHACCYTWRSRLTERYWQARDIQKFRLFFSLSTNQ